MIYHKFRFVWIIFIKSNPIANTTKRLLDILWNYFKTLKKKCLHEAWTLRKHCGHLLFSLLTACWVDPNSKAMRKLKSLWVSKCSRVTRAGQMLLPSCKKPGSSWAKFSKPTQYSLFLPCFWSLAFNDISYPEVKLVSIAKNSSHISKV